MKWLEIPAHRVLEVECIELVNDFVMYDEAGTTLCSSGTANLLFGRKDGKRFNFRQFFLSNELSKGIEPICKRSEVLPMAGNRKALPVLKSLGTHPS
jgi:hypothetical protein